VVGKARERVLIFEPLHVLLALRELEPEAPQLPHGKPGKSRKPNRNRSGKGQETKQHVGCRPLRLPAEPADDAPVAIEHGLQFTAALWGVALETQVLQA
jgi:hypothetical protein